MSELKFEDYRQPWETGPHWELKKEFIEKYIDTFPEDRLLCLAQAYSNIVLMNCCYPDPVMRQISILSKPLEMRKRFQENSAESKAPKGHQDKKVSEKLKSIYENSGRPFKQMKFCASGEHVISSNSAVSNENVTEPSKNTLNLTVHDHQAFQPPCDSVSTVNKKIDRNQACAIVNESDKTNFLQHTEKEKNILSIFGSEFIQNFTQFVRNFQSKCNSPLEAISSAAQKLKIQNQIHYDISLVPGSPVHTPLYSSKVSFKNCVISTGTGMNKKKAKIKSAEATIDVLIKLSSTCLSTNNTIELNTASEAKNVSLNNQTVQESAHGGERVNKKMKVQELSEKIVDKTKEQPIISCRTSMFNSSLRDGFVLVDNLSLKPECARNLRTLLSESAGFCHKSFEYRVDDALGMDPPSKKTYVIIGKETVGTGIASSKEESKILACENAFEMLKRKYCTLKVKNEYIDGYIISRKQVFEGESFSNGALTESNIGCKMLKSMGWTGGGLGPSGILEPVEARGHHSFGRGLGYGNDLGDVQLFKKRIESMLQDYSRTNTLSDLVFSKEFSKDERKEIHRIALKFHLHTASRGVNENRFLTVRHKYNVTQVLNYLVNHGGSNSKFELIDASERTFEL